MARGKILRLFVGNMASGKTRHLLAEIETLRKYGNKLIIVFKPKTDTRSGDSYIASRKGDKDTAHEISSANVRELFTILRDEEVKAGTRFAVIAFDEVQFFGKDSGLFALVNQLLDEGYDILAAGLELDFRGEPFGSTPYLILLAREQCMWLTSYCTKCGNPACFPQRIIDGRPAPYDSPQILVGGDDTYEPRCHDHFILPGRPSIKD